MIWFIIGLVAGWFACKYNTIYYVRLTWAIVWPWIESLWKKQEAASNTAPASNTVTVEASNTVPKE